MGTDARPSNIPFIASVIGPDGQRLTLADLPRPDTRRWVSRRKAEVVAAVEGGLLSLQQACQRYSLTPEEFLEWESSLHRYGLPGLKATHAHRHTFSGQRFQRM